MKTRTYSALRHLYRFAAATGSVALGVALVSCAAPPAPGPGLPGPGFPGPGLPGPGLPGPGLPGPGFPLPGFGSPSDTRLKENVTSYERGLEDLGQIRPVTFDYRSDNPRGYPRRKANVGVVAQQVESAYPEAVSRDGKGYRRVDTAPIFWSAINSIKELEQENQRLRARVERLEGDQAARE